MFHYMLYHFCKDKSFFSKGPTNSAPISSLLPKCAPPCVTEPSARPAVGGSPECAPPTGSISCPSRVLYEYIFVPCYRRQGDTRAAALLWYKIINRGTQAALTYITVTAFYIEMTRGKKWQPGWPFYRSCKLFTSLPFRESVKCKGSNFAFKNDS